jgi:vacuolar-type H+-ATPase subunit I/STV1
MKMAVIMAVLHMCLGVIQKGTNTIYFGKLLEFWTEVVAGLVIFLGLFGWMDALIVAKWFYRIDIDDTSENYGYPLTYDGSEDDESVSLG